MHDVKEDCKAEYLVYADTVKNILHMIPCFFQKYASDKYSYPPQTTQREEYTFFSNNFSDIGLSLSGSTIIYYGIDKVSYEPQIQTFTFNEERKCYEASSILSNMLIDDFEKELAKECLYLQTYME